MLKHIWVVNHHALIPSKDGSLGRHMHLAQELTEHGWKSSIIVASTKHPTGEQALKGKSRVRMTSEQGVPVLWIRSKAYTSGLRARALGMVAFAVNLCLPRATSKLESPDVVMGSTVHPFAAWAGLQLARRHKVPFVFEIRDVWPETLEELGAISPGGFLARTTRALMRLLAKRASLVVSPLPYIDLWLAGLELEEKPFVWISNGTDSVGDTPPTPVPIRESFTFMYMGSHGPANILDRVLEAFDDASRRRPDLDLRLRLVGDGPDKDLLMEQAKGLHSAARISFEPRIPGSEVKSRAAEADAMISALDDLPVYRFGISLNKLFTYLDSGRPIVWASSAPNNPIRDAGAGICVESNDHDAFTKAMISMATLPPMERSEMALKGWQHVRDNYTFNILARKFAESLDQVVELDKS